MGTAQEQVIRSLFNAMSRGSMEDALALFSESATYSQQAWKEPAVGRPAILAEFRRQAQTFSELHSDIVTIVSDECRVLVERLDSMRIAGKACTLHFMGAFDLDADDRITSWRDHYDMDEVKAVFAGRTTD